MRTSCGAWRAGTRLFCSKYRPRANRSSSRIRRKPIQSDWLRKYINSDVIKADLLIIVSSMRRKVVITGLGAVTPLANTAPESWAALLLRGSGVRSYIDDPVLKNKSKLNVALVKDFDYRKWRVPVLFVTHSMQAVA